MSDSQDTTGPLPPTEPRRSRSAFGVVLRAVVPLVILSVGVAGYMILSVEPKRAKTPPTPPQALRTRVLELRSKDHQVVIKTHGVVRPHSEVVLTSQVPGRINAVHPGLEDGAFFAEGEVLIELESIDYETAVIAAEAQVARARAAHALEETRAKQARLNWEDLGYKEEPNELVLRLPQLRESKAAVDSALAQLARTKRDLERTRIRAPFEGRVRRRSVGLGQSVGAGTPLATVFTVEFAEVRLPIAAREIGFVDLPETAQDTPVEVTLRSSLDETDGPSWKARIVRTEGALDESSLELFAIARVDDPFGRKSGLPPLRVGQPVTGLISGRVLTNVVALPRMAVRQLDQVLLVDRGTMTLQSRTIVPLWSDEQHILVRDPLVPGGAWLSLTHLVYAPNGAKVEIIPDPTATAGMDNPKTNPVPSQAKTAGTTGTARN